MLLPRTNFSVKFQPSCEVRSNSLFKVLCQRSLDWIDCDALQGQGQCCNNVEQTYSLDRFTLSVWSHSAGGPLACELLQFCELFEPLALARVIVTLGARKKTHSNIVSLDKRLGAPCQGNAWKESSSCLGWRKR